MEADPQEKDTPERKEPTTNTGTGEKSQEEEAERIGPKIEEILEGNEVAEDIKDTPLTEEIKVLPRTKPPNIQEEPKFNPEEMKKMMER